MKRLIAAAVLLAVVLGICFAGNRIVTDIHSETLAILDECEAAILSGDSNRALWSARSAVSYWKKRRLIISVFINHERYEDTEISLVKISRLVSGSTAIDALPECAAARVMLREISAEQKFKLENIL